MDGADLYAAALADDWIRGGHYHSGFEIRCFKDVDPGDDVLGVVEDESDSAWSSHSAISGDVFASSPGVWAESRL